MASRLSTRVLFLILVFTSACAQTGPGKSINKMPRLEFAFDQIGPKSIDGQKYPFGGLSAIDYDEKNHSLVAISDDRNINGPYRYYQIPLQKKNLPKADWTQSKLIPLLGDKNKALVRMKYDFEGIALLETELIVSSEGNLRKPFRYAPEVVQVNSANQLQRRFAVPEQFFSKNKTEYGIQSNKAFESLALAQKDQLLFTATEEPLVQDLKSGFLRIIRYSLNSSKSTAQWAYPFNGKTNAGLTDLEHLSGSEFLAIERKWDSKIKKTTVIIYHVDCSKAQDVSKLSQLGGKEKACGKNELLNLDKIIGQLNRDFPVIDNIEGITFGKSEKNFRWLYLISDDNFNKHQRTQLLAFKFFTE